MSLSNFVYAAEMNRNEIERRRRSQEKKNTRRRNIVNIMTLKKNLVEFHAKSVKIRRIESNHEKKSPTVLALLFNESNNRCNDSVGRPAIFGCVI